jgi:RNA polymerase sigma factor (sigma-70 family)
MRLAARTLAWSRGGRKVVGRLTTWRAFAHGVTNWDAPATETVIERRQMRQIVRRCIDRLAESYRALLRLRDIEERDTDEGAELLGLTVSAMKRRLPRARQALRELLADALEHAVG